MPFSVLPLSARLTRPRPARLLALGVLVIGLAVSALLAAWLHRGLVLRLQERFDRHAAELEEDIRQRLERAADGLIDLQALFAARPDADEQAFARFVEVQSRMGALESGVRGYALALPRGRLSPGAADGAVPMVVRDAQPRQALQPLLGLDLAAQPVLREALERSLRDGRPALTGALALPGDTRLSLSLLLPLYRGDAAPASEPRRRAELAGVLLAPLSVNELLAGIAQTSPGRGDLDFDLLDGTRAPAPHLHAGLQPPRVPRFAVTRRLEAGGRVLELRVASSARFDADAALAVPWWVGGGGAALSVLLAFTMWLLARGRARALALAGHMTAELDRLARVAQRTSNAVLITDAACGIEWVNEGFTRLFGYLPHEARGRTPMELLGGSVEDITALRALAREAPASGRELSLQLRHRDGLPRPVALELQAVRDAVGAVQSFMLICHDRSAQHALERERLRLANVLEGADVGTWEFSLGDRRLHIDERWASMLGRRLQELLPADERTWLRLTHPEDAARALSLLERHIAGELGYYDVEIRMRHREGHWVWMLARGRVVTRDAQGRPLTVAGTHTDITRRKRAEQALRRARDQALAASSAKSAFLANMSHEIRTPMNSVLGMLALLRRGGLTPVQDDRAAKSEAAARSLLALLDDILDLSKVEAGRLTLEPQPFRPAQLFEELQVLLQGSLVGKPVALRMALDPALPPVLVGDALRLRQVLLNLGGNAVKFTAGGEVEVALRLLQRRGGSVQVELSVRDTGLGIAPSQQAQLFEPFTQAEASITRRFGGTGLGLAISRRLVRLMGGELQLDSAAGVGSRFHCRLELALARPEQLAALPPPAASGAQRAAGAAGQALAGLRLLVAEDNPHNREVALELLRGEGALVELAATGLEAVAAVAAGQFDAVLMDLQMPDMDGFTATARIRQALGLDRLPIIAMTANAAPADRAASLAAGMNDHVGKPFELRQLVAVLRRHTGQEGAAPAAAPGADDGMDAGTDVAALPALDLDGALQRFQGRAGLYARLLGNACAQFEALLPQCAALLGQGQRDAAAQALHRCRSLAGTLGARRLAAAAHALERPLLAGEDAPAALLASLEAAVEHTLAEAALHAPSLAGRGQPGLAQDGGDVPVPALSEAPGRAHEAGEAGAVDGSPADGAGAASPAGLAAGADGHAEEAGAAASLPLPASAQGLLRELLGLLAQSDLAALQAHARLQLALPAARRRELDEAMAVLDFQTALAHCRRLLATE
ncbi:ATP-binding protein [Azohydromonas lata]|uniref:ATP-binding protein n=1 Tax=Azohydromonas lata TaxID=45677 RepID=UPI00083488DF|nr:ATP-binding protein [Azohydromonas lata]